MYHSVLYRIILALYYLLSATREIVELVEGFGRRINEYRSRQYNADHVINPWAENYFSFRFRPPARVRSGGGAAARAGRRLWAWRGVFPGAGFWKMLHLAITIS